MHGLRQMWWTEMQDENLQRVAFQTKSQQTFAVVVSAHQCSAWIPHSQCQTTKDTYESTRCTATGSRKHPATLLGKRGHSHHVGHFV